MRGLGLFLLGLLLTIPAAAQRGGGGRGGGGGFHGGMGGGFHGGMGGGFHGGMGGGFHGGGFGGSGFHGGFNNFHGGYRYFRGGYFPRNRFFFGLGYYPWGYGAGWGYPYYGYPYYDYSYSNYPSSYYGDPSSASSPVVIYQSPPAPMYEAPEIPSTTYSTQGNGKTIYLIALRGQENICAAQAYWVTQKTLHFITLDGEARQAPIESVDRALTFKLNRDRNVDFQLPTGK